MDRTQYEVNEMARKDDKTVSTAEAAILLGCTLQNVYNTVRVGRFAGARRVDGQWQIPQAAIAAYIERRKQRAAMKAAA